MKKWFEEFKTFAFKGNVIDMAVGVIIGAAFGAIVSSLINDVLMPLIGKIIAVDFSQWFIALDGNKYASVSEATEAGVAVVNFGSFFSAIVYFILVAICIFLVVKSINSTRKRMEELKKKEEEKPAEPAKEPRRCPYCFSEIHDEATRCPHCTSELPKE